MRSPWNAGSISLRCSMCDAAVEQDHRVVADDRLQHPRPLARAQDVGRRGEHLLDLLRLGDHHERRRERELQREALAVARPAALEEGQRSGPEAEHLDRRGIGRSRGKARVHALLRSSLAAGQASSPHRARSVRWRTQPAAPQPVGRRVRGNNSRFDGLGRDRIAELHRPPRDRGRGLRPAHARPARGPAPAPRGPLRRRARRDHGDRPPLPRLARRRAPVPPRRPAGRGARRTPLPGRLGDGLGAAHPQRRVHRPPRRRRGLARGAARDRRAPLRADRARRQQRAPAAALGPAPLRALRALGLADRGRRPVLRRPDVAVPRRRQHPHAPGAPARLPALGPRRDHPRRHGLRPARARARPRRLRDAGLAAAPRGRHARDRARLRRPLSRGRARVAALPARGPARAPARSASSPTKPPF